MLTINKWRNLLKSSQYYNAINTEKEKTLDRQRGYMFEGKYRKTSYKNVLYYFLCNEFLNKFQRTEFQVYAHINLQGESVKMDYKGMFIYIHTSFSICWEPVISYTFLNKSYSFTVNSNQELTKDFIIKEVLKHNEKNNLFKEGFFRNLQEHFNASKERTVFYYKSKICGWWKPEKSCRHTEVLEFILKKYNIDIDYTAYKCENKAYKFALDYVNKHGKPKETIYIEKFNPLAFLDSFDGDIDEIETLFNDHLENHPNTIFC